jgi:hypothetical protein
MRRRKIWNVDVALIDSAEHEIDMAALVDRFSNLSLCHSIYDGVEGHVAIRACKTAVFGNRSFFEFFNKIRQERSFADERRIAESMTWTR